MQSQSGKTTNRGQGLLLLLAFFLHTTLVIAGPMDVVRLHPAIPLLDESGAHVLDSGNPYSSKMSCGTAGCHDYGSITHAFHIEQGRDETRDDYGKLRGVPQLVGPGYFGGYNCMSGNNPDQLAKKTNASVNEFADLGAAGWVQRCATCHAGGGWMEKDRNGRRYDLVDPATVTAFDGDYFNRGTDENNQPASKDTVAQWDWKKSGVVENDCLICHVDFKALKTFGEQPVILDHGKPVTDALNLFRGVRVNEMIKQGFFRYTNSALLGYINLNLTTDTSLDKAILNGFKRNPDADNALLLDDDGLPQLNWNTAAFVEGKVEIPMLRFPGNDNCMNCHRTSNSRRGFYGFGEGAETNYDEAGTPIEDTRTMYTRACSGLRPMVKNGPLKTVMPVTHATIITPSRPMSIWMPAITSSRATPIWMCVMISILHPVQSPVSIVITMQKTRPSPLARGICSVHTANSGRPRGICSVIQRIP